MDCSNPVRDSSRASIADMINSTGIRRRQELSYLKALAEGKERFLMDEFPDRDVSKEERARELDTLLEAQTHVVSPTPIKEVPFLEKVGECPVSGLMHDGVPIHPPGVHQTKGVVTTTRTFGGCKPNRGFLALLLEKVPADHLVGPASKYVYTHGEANGFLKRLKEQTSRRTVSIRHYPYSGLKEGKPAEKKFLLNILRSRLPVVRALPDWGEEILDQLLRIETSKISSAGPPYWRDKAESIKDLMETTLPLVVDAISRGAEKQLAREQPEMFLVEAKNKLDRYEPSKLADKVRPYFALPFHWQVLFSMLSQPFGKSLGLFHEVEGSANAYGLSWAHGGAQKTVQWARSISEERDLRYYCYGDDSDVFWRSKGSLWRASPDFRQMDGSVDADTVDLVLNYIVESFSKQHPDPETKTFWERVCDQWYEFALNPDFLIHGPSVYSKDPNGARAVGGLMTGVVGTTLFDTVKSILAYECLRTAYATGSIELDSKSVSKFMAELGLELKEGTWVPEVVREDPVPGELFSSNKFLGMRLMYRQGPHKVEPVPSLDDDEWLEMILAPKEDPLSRIKTSFLSEHRTRFDRARGYLVTGAYHNPNISRLLGGIVNGVQPEAILMAVQADNGRGEKPEFSAPLGGVEGDFSFPTSEGIPSEKWCDNLYFSEDNQWPEEEAPWQLVYPSIRDEITSWKATWSGVKPRITVKEVRGKEAGATIVGEAALSKEVVSIKTGPPATMLELDPEHEYPDSYPVTPVKTPRTDRKRRDRVQANSRSKVANVITDDKGKVQIQEKPRLPRLEEVVARAFREQDLGVKTLKNWILDSVNVPEGQDPAMASEVLGLWAANSDLAGLSAWETPVAHLVAMASQLGRTVEDMAARLRDLGYYILGKGPSRIVLSAPIASPDREEANRLAEQMRENEESLMQKDMPPVREKPTLAKIVARSTGPLAKITKDVVVERGFSMRPIEARWDKKSDSLVSYLFSVLQTNKLKGEFKARVVSQGATSLVETVLEVEGLGRVASSLAHSARTGKLEIARALLSPSVTKGEVLQRAGATARSARRREKLPTSSTISWADEIEQDMKAEIFMASSDPSERPRVLGSLRGTVIVVEAPLVSIPTGYKVVNRGAARVLADTRETPFVRRRAESQSSFLRRVIKSSPGSNVWYVKPQPEQNQSFSNNNNNNNKDERSDSKTTTTKEKAKKWGADSATGGAGGFRKPSKKEK